MEPGAHACSATEAGRLRTREGLMSPSARQSPWIPVPLPVLDEPNLSFSCVSNQAASPAREIALSHVSLPFFHYCPLQRVFPSRSLPWLHALEHVGMSVYVQGPGRATSTCCRPTLRVDTLRPVPSHTFQVLSPPQGLLITCPPSPAPQPLPLAGSAGHPPPAMALSRFPSWPYFLNIFFY